MFLTFQIIKSKKNKFLKNNLLFFRIMYYNIKRNRLIDKIEIPDYVFEDSKQYKDKIKE